MSAKSKMQQGLASERAREISQARKKAANLDATRAKLLGLKASSETTVRKQPRTVTRPSSDEFKLSDIKIKVKYTSIKKETEKLRAHMVQEAAIHLEKYKKTTEKTQRQMDRKLATMERAAAEDKERAKQQQQQHDKEMQGLIKQIEKTRDEARGATQEIKDRLERFAGEKEAELETIRAQQKAHEAETAEAEAEAMKEIEKLREQGKEDKKELERQIQETERKAREALAEAERKQKERDEQRDREYKKELKDLKDKLADKLTATSGGITFILGHVPETPDKYSVKVRNETGNNVYWQGWQQKPDGSRLWQPDMPASKAVQKDTSKYKPTDFNVGSSSKSTITINKNKTTDPYKIINASAGTIDVYEIFDPEQNKIHKATVQFQTADCIHWEWTGFEGTRIVNLKDGSGDCLSGAAPTGDLSYKQLEVIAGVWLGVSDSWKGEWVNTDGLPTGTPTPLNVVVTAGKYSSKPDTSSQWVSEFLLWLETNYNALYNSWYGSPEALAKLKASTSHTGPFGLGGGYKSEFDYKYRVNIYSTFKNVYKKNDTEKILLEKSFYYDNKTKANKEFREYKNFLGNKYQNRTVSNVILTNIINNNENIAREAYLNEPLVLNKLFKRY